MGNGDCQLRIAEIRIEELGIADFELRTMRDEISKFEVRSSKFEIQSRCSLESSARNAPVR